MADFIAEFTHKEELKQGEKKQEGDNMVTEEECQLYVDGASNSQGSGAGMVFITPEGAVIERFVTLGFTKSNN